MAFLEAGAEAEVAQLDVPTRIQQQIIWFYIPGRKDSRIRVIHLYKLTHYKHRILAIDTIEVA